MFALLQMLRHLVERLSSGVLENMKEYQLLSRLHLRRRWSSRSLGRCRAVLQPSARTQLGAARLSVDWLHVSLERVFELAPASLERWKVA